MGKPKGEPDSIVSATLTLFNEEKPLDTYSEEWRAECEARYVCNIKSKYERNLYLQGVLEKRGKEPAAKLRRDVLMEWNKSRGVRR
jgi:hypothetical protein